MKLHSLRSIGERSWDLKLGFEVSLILRGGTHLLNCQLGFGDCAIENCAVDFVGFDPFPFECV